MRRGSLEASDYSVLEKVGVGVGDSVHEANEKRTQEYDRQARFTSDYFSRGYLEEWAQQEHAQGSPEQKEWVMQNRLEYQRFFDVVQEGSTQLVSVIVMDNPLRDLLVQARDEILADLCTQAGVTMEAAQDMASSPIWLPDLASIPPRDLHITLVLPRRWRQAAADAQAQRAYNEGVAETLGKAVAGHEVFLIELDRLALEFDGSLIALFRAVGPSEAQRSSVADFGSLPSAREGRDPPLVDRGSGSRDPMTALRADIISQFLESDLVPAQGKGTADGAGQGPRSAARATIVNSVGGSVHGYVHCSLCRFAISPKYLLKQIDLGEALDTVREWSSRLSGRRMKVRGFKLVEMTGLGVSGRKNPLGSYCWEQDIPLRAPWKKQDDTPSWLVSALCCRTRTRTRTD